MNHESFTAGLSGLRYTDRQPQGPSAHAEGTAVPYQSGAGMPHVSWGTDGPIIAVPPGATPPKKLVSTVLVRGRGKPILNGQTVVARYSGVV
jgi:hypothetical protein